MKVHSTSTDNTGLKNKIKLRKECTQGLDTVRVLDLFAGENKIWKNIRTDRYYGIEMEKHKGKNLHANNLKVIPSLNLSEFNVIDCDAYGIPFQQIEALYKNGTLQKGTIIIYTAISNAFSSVNKKCLEEYGLKKMYDKNKVLINKLALPLFFETIRKRGVRSVKEYEIADGYVKKYGYFKV